MRVLVSFGCLGRGVAKEGVEQVEGWEDHDQDRDHKYADLSHFTVLQSDGMSESTAKPIHDAA